MIPTVKVGLHAPMGQQCPNCKSTSPPTRFEALERERLQFTCRDCEQEWFEVVDLTVPAKTAQT